MQRGRETASQHTCNKHLSICLTKVWLTKNPKVITEHVASWDLLTINAKPKDKQPKISGDRCQSFGLFSVLKSNETCETVSSHIFQKTKMATAQSNTNYNQKLFLFVFFFSYQVLKEVENDLRLYKISLLPIFLNCRAL